MLPSIRSVIPLARLATRLPVAQRIRVAQNPLVRSHASQAPPPPPPPSPPKLPGQPGNMYWNPRERPDHYGGFRPRTWFFIAAIVGAVVYGNARKRRDEKKRNAENLGSTAPADDKKKKCLSKREKEAAAMKEKEHERQQAALSASAVSSPPSTSAAPTEKKEEEKSETPFHETEASKNSIGFTGVGTTETYDVVVDASDVRALTNSAQGWTVEQKTGLDNKSGGVVVAVLGVYNRGKTFLLNKISNSELPNSVTVHTRGLSFKLPQHWSAQNFVLLDTAGLQAPVRMGDAQAIAARQKSDLLMTELAFDMADVVIVVVSDVTLQDQIFLQAVFEQLGDQPKRFQDVIVVHNYKDVQDIDTVKKLWKTQVVGSYPGELVTEPLIYSKDVGDTALWWRHASAGSRIVMRHVALAKDGSEAGDALNYETYRLLHKWISSVQTAGSAPIMDRFVNTCNDVLSDEGLRVKVEQTPAGQQRITAEPVTSSSQIESSATASAYLKKTRLRDRLAFQNILTGGNLLGLTKFRHTPSSGFDTGAGVGGSGPAPATDNIA